MRRPAKLRMVAESADKMRSGRWPPMVKRVPRVPLLLLLTPSNEEWVAGGAVEGQVVKKIDGESENVPSVPDFRPISYSLIGTETSLSMCLNTSRWSIRPFLTQASSSRSFVESKMMNSRSLALGVIFSAL